MVRPVFTGRVAQPTALINEAYLKLVDPSQFDLENRAHFFGVAARAMRQVLVDHARVHGNSRLLCHLFARAH